MLQEAGPSFHTGCSACSQRFPHLLGDAFGRSHHSKKGPAPMGSQLGMKQQDSIQIAGTVQSPILDAAAT